MSLVDRKVYFGNPERARLRLSPDGEMIAYLAPLEGVMNLWVAPTGNLSRARPVTSDTHRGIRWYDWTYSPGRLVYMRDSDGDENWHLYLVDPEEGTERDLTPLEGVSARPMGHSHLHPGRILVGLNDRDPHLHDVYSVTLESGEREAVLENEGFATFIADQDLQVRLGIRFTPEGGLQCMVRGDGGWEELYTVGPEDATTSGPLGLDAEGVLWTGWSRGRNTSALRSVDLQTGETRIHASHPRADLGLPLVVHPRTQRPQAVPFEYLREEYVVLDEDIAADMEYLQSLDRGDVTVVSRSLDDRLWVVATRPDVGPVRYYLYDRDRGRAELLCRSRPELEDLQLSRMHPVEIEASDGMRLVCYFTLPADADSPDGSPPPEPLPTVLYVHGGPWARDSWGYHPVHQWLADRGYFVLSVNFRGSTGLGKEYLNAGNGQWAGEMHRDLLDAVDWAAAEGYADRDRVAIMGGSYGGYATLVGLTFTPEAFACGVDIVGPSSLVTLLQNVPPYWMPMMPMMEHRVGALPDTEEGRSYLMERSPITRVRRIRRPLLIGQGANDPRVTKVEADQIVEAMRSKDLPVTYLLYPDEGHGFQRPENRLSFFAVAERFLARHIGGRYQPPGEAFEGSSVEVVDDGGLPGLGAPGPGRRTDTEA
jgi:dipeptidyl aminopeptidase/acylaminoacyl peptidase